MRIVKATAVDGRTVFPAGEAALALAAAKPERIPAADISQAVARILRPQAATRWLLPQLAAITPQYIESTLRGALAGNHVQQWELFDLMEDTWPRLRKNVAELKNAVSDMRPALSAFSEDEEDDASDTAKDRLKLCTAGLRAWRTDAASDENAMRGTVYDIMDAWFKGTSVLEIDWQISALPKLGQFVAPRSTFWVHPVCYAWGNDGRLGLRLDARGQVNPGAYQSFQPNSSATTDFPPQKFIIANCKSKSGTALGGALLRPLAWWWCAANFSADWLLNLAQVFGLPFRWATYRTGAPQGTIDAICSMLQNMGSAGWAAFPEGTQLDLKAEGTKSGKETPQGDLIDRADKNCDLLVLGQTLTSDTGGMGKGGGSMALGKVHAGVKGEIVEAAAGFVSEVLAGQIISPMLVLNYGDDTERPEVCLEKDQDEDLQAAATLVQSLSTAGAGAAIPLAWINKKFAIPVPDGEEPTLQKATSPALASPLNGDPDREPVPPKPGDATEDAIPPEEQPPATNPPAKARALKLLRRVHQIKDDAAFADALRALAQAV